MQVAKLLIHSGCLPTSTLLALYDTHPVLRKEFQCFDLGLQRQDHFFVLQTVNVGKDLSWTAVHRCLRYICFATTDPAQVTAYQIKSVHALGLATLLLAFNYVEQANRLIELFEFTPEDMLDGFASNGRLELVQPYLARQGFEEQLKLRISKKPRIPMTSTELYDHYHLWPLMGNKTYEYLAKFCILTLKSRSLVTLDWLNKKLELERPDSVTRKFYKHSTSHRHHLRAVLFRFPDLRGQLAGQAREWPLPEVVKFVESLV